MLKKQAEPSIIQTSVKVENKNIYLGNRTVNGESSVDGFDVAKLLDLSDGAVVTSKNEDVAVVNGNIITIFKEGGICLEILEEGRTYEKTLITVDGVNVTKADDFSAMSDGYGNIENNVIIQRDLTMEETSPDYNRFEAYKINGSIYGNGFSVNGDNYLEKYIYPVFIITGQDVTIRDLKIYGMAIEEGEEIALDDFSAGGTLFVFMSAKAYVENCIFENSDKNIMIKNSEVYFRNCLFRNASDTNISIKTFEQIPSNVTIENCIFADAVVAGILNWCDTEVDESAQCTISIKGDTYFYNWKEVRTAKMIPQSEPNADLFNAFIRSVFYKSEKGFVVRFNKKEYINTAIIVICSDKNSVNTPVINGLWEQKLKKQTLPLGSIISNYLTTADVYGYTDTKRLPPDSVLTDNPYFKNRI